jgi:hypothetical protein
LAGDETSFDKSPNILLLASRELSLAIVFYFLLSFPLTSFLFSDPKREHARSLRLLAIATAALRGAGVTRGWL